MPVLRASVVDPHVVFARVVGRERPLAVLLGARIGSFARVCAFVCSKVVTYGERLPTAIFFTLEWLLSRVRSDVFP